MISPYFRDLRPQTDPVSGRQPILQMSLFHVLQYQVESSLPFGFNTNRFEAVGWFGHNPAQQFLLWHKVPLAISASIFWWGKVNIPVT